MHCFAKICRLCTENKNIKLNLYTVDSDNITLLDKLLTLVPDTVKCTDNLPEYICAICYLQLKNAYAFVKKCLKTHKQLKYYSKLLKSLSTINTEHCKKYNSEMENKANSILNVNLEQSKSFVEYIEKSLHKIVKEENNSNIHENETCNYSFNSNENLLSLINNDIERTLKEKLSLENLEIIPVKQEKLMECNDNDESNGFLKKICLLKNENSISSCDVSQDLLNFDTDNNSDSKLLINQNITQNLCIDKSTDQIDQIVAKTESDSDVENSGSILDDCVTNGENLYFDFENTSINHSNISNDNDEAIINFTNEIQVPNNTNNTVIQFHNNSNTIENSLSIFRNRSGRSRNLLNYRESDVSDSENSDDDISYSFSSSSSESDSANEGTYNKSITNHTTKPGINYANKNQNNLPSTSNMNPNNNKTMLEMLLTTEKNNIDISRGNNESSTLNISPDNNKTIPEKLLILEENNIDISMENNNSSNILPSTSNMSSNNSKTILSTLEKNDVDISMENKISDDNKKTIDNNNFSSTSKTNAKSYNTNLIKNKKLKVQNGISKNKRVVSRNKAVPKSRKESLHEKLKKLSKIRYPPSKKPITQTTSNSGNGDISTDTVAINNNELPAVCSDNCEEKIRTNDNVANSENKLPILNSNINEDVTKNSDILLNKLPETSTHSNKEITDTDVINNTNIKNKISRNDTQFNLQSKTVSSSNSNQQQNDAETVESLSEDDDEVVVNPTYNNLGLIEHELIHPNEPGTTFIYIRDTEQSYFFCKTCNRQFSDRYTLDKHLRRHISEKTFKCDKCDFRSYTAKNVREHMVVHITERNFKCDICGKSYKSESHLQAHKTIHSKKFTCEICGKTFGAEYQLKRHKLLHSDEKNFKCTKCDWSGKTSENKRRHMLKKHSKIKHEFKCDICNRIMRTHIGFNSHMMKHDEKNLKYECIICHKKFFEKKQLVFHTRLHTGAKPYKCEYCGKTFRMSCPYRNHLRIHTGQKPFKCDVCEKSFTQQTTLQVHKRIHTGERPYKCDKCEKTFVQSYTYKLHLKKHEKQLAESSFDSSCSSCSSDTE